LKSAPPSEQAKNKMRGENRSDSAKKANTSVPTMKPTCTAEVM